MVPTKDDAIDTIDEQVNQTEPDDHSARVKTSLKDLLNRDTQAAP